MRHEILQRLRDLSERPPFSTARTLFSNLVEEDENYEQFETRSTTSEVVTFRENDREFHLFGTNVHVKIGAYIACAIGFCVTALFCFSYSLYHTRGTGRNDFIDHLEFVDLVFAFLVGLPCHVLLFLGIQRENKKFFNPFLVFYLTNFILNVVFTFLTIVAAAFDFYHKVFGNVTYDISWTFFQICFTSLQGLAIYVVIKCRRYVAARAFFNNRLDTRRSSSLATNVVDEA